MKYKRVFAKARYSTRGQSKFRAHSRTKELLLGPPTDTGRNALIGKVIEHGRTSSLLDYGVYCDISFPHVIGVFGSRGSGKSFDLGVLLEEIFLRQSAPVTDAGVVFDVQDQFWTLAHKPRPELDEDCAQLDALSSWGLEPRAVPNLSLWVPAASDTEVPAAQTFAISPDQLTAADWLQLLELERYSAMGHALLTLLEDLGPATPDVLMGACDDRRYQDLFHPSTLDGIRWRLGSVGATKVVAASGVNVDALLRPGTLTVVLMRNLSDAIRALVVGVIARLVADRLGRAHQARKVARRTESPDVAAGPQLASRLWLVLDEAHVLVPSGGTTAATAPLIDYVKRGRDAGLSLIFATQQPSAVSHKLLSQVDLTLTHTLGFEADLNAAVARMPTRTAVEYDIESQRVSSLNDVIRSLRPGEAVVADGFSDQIFIAKIRPRVTAHGGSTPT